MIVRCNLTQDPLKIEVRKNAIYSGIPNKLI